MLRAPGSARAGLRGGPAWPPYWPKSGLPASVFGEGAAALRMRVATGLPYGDTGAQRDLAPASPDPVSLPWIAAVLDRIGEILADLTR